MGVAELAGMIARHREYLRQSGDWHRRERARLQSELDNLLQETLVSRWRVTISESQYQAVLSLLVERRVSPHQAVERLIDGKEQVL
jgi:LAO/AO transport system kinase